MKHTLICIYLACLLPACSQRAEDANSYFPLTPGLQWTYRVTTVAAGMRKETRLQAHNAYVTELNGKPHTVRVTDQGTRYYVGESPAGIYRAAKRTIVELRPQPDDPPRWILKRPIQIGSSWSQTTHPYVLQRLHPYTESLAKGIAFKMAYQISSLSDTVEVPAGRFENCVRVDGDAQLTLYADGRTGYQDIPINTSEWYAPGVGLVKLERTEPLKGDVFAGGMILLELERFPD